MQETTARGGGGKSWNVSQVAIPALQFQDEGVCHRCSDHQRPAGKHTCDAVILSHTHTHPTSRNYAHILHRVTPHRLGMGVRLLYPVVGQPASQQHSHLTWLALFGCGGTGKHLTLQLFIR